MEDAVAHAPHDLRGAPENVALAGLMLPWYAASLLLPSDAVWLSLALLTVLAMLVKTSAWWARQRAARHGRDAVVWGLAATLSFGYANAFLLVGAPDLPLHPQSLCHDCGRLGDAREAFCYGCGSA